MEQTAVVPGTLVIPAILTLQERIERGKYDDVNEHLAKGHFPLYISVDYTIESRLFRFGHEITSSDAIVEIERSGFHPGTLPEILTFGETYPDEQRKYSIAALRSFWFHPDAGPCVLFLDQLNGLRRLTLSRIAKAKWGINCRFLGIRRI